MVDNFIITITRLDEEKIVELPPSKTLQDFYLDFSLKTQFLPQDITEMSYKITSKIQYRIEKEEDFQTMLEVARRMSMPLINISIVVDINKTKLRDNLKAQQRKLQSRLEKAEKQLDKEYLKIKEEIMNYADKQIKFKFVSGNYNHHTKCSKCDKNIIGRLYKCLSCAKNPFNLCDDCLVLNSKVHFHNHLFIVILSNESYQKQLKGNEQTLKEQ